MKPTYLPKKIRTIARALIEVVKPRKPGFDLAVEDYMLDFLDEFYSYFPIHLKIGFPAGLLLLEYGTFIFDLKARPFTSLSLAEREKSVAGWINSKLNIRRDMIKGVKGVCLTGFYSHPEAMAHIGFDLPAHLARVAKGEPADPVACAYFREKGYDRNVKVPHPCFDRVYFVCHDTPPEEGK